MHNKHSSIRECVFVESLRRHGFRLVSRRKNLKRSYGYVIFATRREDDDGIDVWVKFPCEHALIPVQLTQRGVKQYRRRTRDATVSSLWQFIDRSNERVRQKKNMCERSGILFVLLADTEQEHTDAALSNRDVGALRYARRAYRKHVKGRP